MSTSVNENELCLKKSFKHKQTIEPFFTGGKIAYSPLTNQLVCPVGDEIHVIDYTSGETSYKLKGNTDIITCLTMLPNGQSVVSATRSLLLKVWDLTTGLELRSWKAHSAPVLSMDIDPSSSLLATGSADATIRVWDMQHLFCTHNFRGHRGIITSLRFHSKMGEMLLFSGDEEGLIKVWDLNKKSCIATLESHVSPIRGLDFTPDYRYLISGGRDKVFNIWNMTTWKLETTVPVYEFVEACGVISTEEKSLVYTAGEKGVVKIWDWKTGKTLSSVHVDALKKHSVSDIIYCKEKNYLMAVTSDQNIIVYDVSNAASSGEPLPKIKQLVGYNEEVLEFAFLDGPDGELSRLAVATNSEQIRIYDLSTRDCEILYGHKEIALCLDASKDGRILVSGSKDHTARVWMMGKQKEDDTDSFECVGECIGHTEAVNALCLGKKTGKMLITGSSDRTIKCWNVANLETTSVQTSVQQLKSMFTFQAHDKDINSIAIAPNEKVFATGSQDKTAKLWSSENGQLLGTCKGHKRGVWCVSFSPVDQVLATSSGDKTIKIWGLKDFSCLKTFEGHLNSVLQVSFCSAGMQLCSSGADGLFKLWTVKSNECVGTFDEHEDKVWALKMSRSEKYAVSGGADSKIVVWEDVTREEAEEEKQIEEKRIIDEQHLSNYIARKDYKKAIRLALKLDKPVYLLNLLDKIVKTSDLDLAQVIEAMICDLDNEQLQKMLFFIRDWNTSARKSEIAQTALNVVLRTIDAERLLELPKLKEVMDGILPYTERHYNRSKKMLIDHFIIDLVVDDVKK